MKRTIVLVLTLLVGYALGQSFGSWSFGPNAPTLASCPAGIAGMTTFCSVGTKTTPYAVWASFDAGVYVQIYPPPAAATGIQSINGKTGPNVTISATVN